MSLRQYKRDGDRKAAALYAEIAEAEKYRKLAILWCKRALAAEVRLAILAEEVVR